MSNIKFNIEKNYTEHPSFQFKISSASLLISDALVSDFNETYLAIRGISTALKNSSRDGMQLKCLNALKEIFITLSMQTRDENEQIFITELHVECHRLVQEEFEWYKKKKYIDFANPDNKASIQMQNDRYFFGQLSQDCLKELSKTTVSEVGKLRENALAGRLKREDLSLTSGSVIRSCVGLLNKEFKSTGILDVVSAYVGHKMSVTGMALELSVPQATWWKNAIGGLSRPPNTLYAHLDESIGYPKSIVYLSDVTEMNGPTGCYPKAYEAMQLSPLQEVIGRVIGIVGTREDSPLKDFYLKQYHQSVNSENFRRHFMRLPANLRFNSHFGWDVAPNSILEDNLVRAENVMIGPAGTFIVFDGARLLHRGGLIEEGERIALQVIFSDMSHAERLIKKLKRIF